MFGLHDRFFNDFYNVPFFSRSRSALPGISGSSLIPRREFDSFINEPLVFRENFFNVENDVKLKEEPDKYLIGFKDDKINEKELKVDFLKKENELKISISQKSESKEGEEGPQSYYSSSYQSSIRFDKPVKFEEIEADVKDGQVSIVIPKVEADPVPAENVVNVAIKGIEPQAPPATIEGSK
ncbi:hypothetical protein PSN45_003875 [Yamadazyma tenuis]|uniref:SHSP domain-containing protein n=1 Tax=Candida tenuis (strain ATCC 10573 / BCRC 21748 / CBS 615 / JCM 9827 / NBRC 10315 / NRRL Y-1498 / VKM Y-70) TaxID=590646 RepID=G3B2Z0_CANTC|nr:uncharacterized protein CANTEDRAFT_114075 [Yamadazyma tenuis ATCC 10573]EGV64037.1 hypothetical protein CANTEDRAFT_114075 [Yamadazyma tenuis ATCC 10573]WEJ96337.1 hypothetical protein PSN45_003875 [Yamadazyma tenuis]